MQENKENVRYIVKLENMGVESYNYVKNKKGILTNNRAEAKLFTSRKKAGKAASKSREVYDGLFNASRILESSCDVVNEIQDDTPTRKYIVKVFFFGRTEQCSYLYGKHGLIASEICDACLFESKDKTDEALQAFNWSNSMYPCTSQTLEYESP